MADDNIWRRGGDRPGGRRGGRGGGRRGNRDRGRDTHHLSRVEDNDGDSYMDERPPRYQPYQSGGRDRSESRRSGGRVSAFQRLGRTRGQGSSGYRSGGVRPGGGGGRDDGRSSWHKVTVLKGGTQSREWLMRTLKESVSEPFMAQQIHQLSDKVLFFVEEPRAAEELKGLGRIQSKSGSLTVIVKPSAPPKGVHDSGRPSGGGQQRPPRFSQQPSSLAANDDDVLMDEDPSQVIIQVLGERYKTDTKALDLSNVFHEQKFKVHKIRASMFDRKFVETILSLIGQHCPDLLVLDLSKNQLQRFDAYSSLPSQLRNLKFLDLSDNDLRSVVELEHLQGMTSVTSISLKGNPCEEQARDFVSYSSSVRKYFPNLESLDGQNLPSPVKFDLPVTMGKLPPYVPNHLPSADTKALLVKFLEQFYTLYDGDSREKLLEAYSDEALFSMSIIMPEHQRDHDLQIYFPKSRNLCCLRDPVKRVSLLKHGRIDIVQFVRDLPRTQHHNELFEVDVMTTTNSQIAFVVHGVFSEEGHRGKEPLVRSFTRTFIVTVAGNSVAILNDSLSVTCASSKTVQFVRDNTTQSVFPTSILPTQSVLPAQAILPTPVQGGLLGADPQEARVLKLVEVTKMNVDFSRRCLMENNWDYPTALGVFSNLQANNKIPAEAFL